MTPSRVLVAAVCALLAFHAFVSLPAGTETASAQSAPAAPGRSGDGRFQLASGDFKNDRLLSAVVFDTATGVIYRLQDGLLLEKLDVASGTIKSSVLVESEAGPVRVDLSSESAVRTTLLRSIASRDKAAFKLCFTDKVLRQAKSIDELFDAWKQMAPARIDRVKVVKDNDGAYRVDEN